MNIIRIDQTTAEKVVPPQGTGIPRLMPIHGRPDKSEQTGTGIPAIQRI